MDLLIQAIIALLKMLFGAAEPPAKVGPRERPQGDQGGGYRPRPKTLEEMLAEAKRELEGTSPQGPRPPQGNTPPHSRPREQSVPKPAVPQMQSTPATVTFRPDPAQVPAAKPVVNSAQGRVVKPAVARKVHPQPAIQMQSVITTDAAGFRKQASHEKMRGFRDPAAQAAKVVTIKKVVNPFLIALRRRSGTDKMAIAAQAMVSHEIFGPPRCIQPFRRIR